MKSSTLAQPPPAKASPSLLNWIPSNVALTPLPYWLSCAHISICALT